MTWTAMMARNGLSAVAMGIMDGMGVSYDRPGHMETGEGVDRT